MAPIPLLWDTNLLSLSPLLQLPLVVPEIAIQITVAEEDVAEDPDKTAHRTPIQNPTLRHLLPKIR